MLIRTIAMLACSTACFLLPAQTGPSHLRHFVALDGEYTNPRLRVRIAYKAITFQPGTSYLLSYKVRCLNGSYHQNRDLGRIQLDFGSGVTFLASPPPLTANWTTHTVAITGVAPGTYLTSANTYTAAAGGIGESYQVSVDYDDVSILDNSLAIVTRLYQDGPPDANTILESTGIRTTVISGQDDQYTSSPNPTLFPLRYSAEDHAIAEVSVTQFGAVGDGITDDTNAFQRALWAACDAGSLPSASSTLGGGVVFVPGYSTGPARRHYKLTGRLYVPAMVTLRGDWQDPAISNGVIGGSVVDIYEGRDAPNMIPFLTMGPCSTVRNLSFYYPEQHTTVTAYPWCVQTLNVSDNHNIANVAIVNAYRGILIGPYQERGATGAVTLGSHHIRNVRATALDKGMSIDQVLEFSRCERLTFDGTVWALSGLPYDSPTAAAADAYRRTSGTGIWIGRYDWGNLHDITIDGYAVGMLFGVGKQTYWPPVTTPPTPYPQVRTSNAQVFNLAVDNCLTALRIEGTNEYGVLFTQGTLHATGSGSVAIDVPVISRDTTDTWRADHNGAVAMFQDMSISSTAGASVRVAETVAPVILAPTHLGFQNCTFDSTRAPGVTSPSIDVNDGSISLVACNFIHSSSNFVDINLGSGVQGLLPNGAILNGNLVNGVVGPLTRSGSGNNVFEINTPVPVSPLAVTSHAFPTPLPVGQALVSVLSFGADRTGVSDSYAAFSSAITAIVSSGGGTVYVPAGEYVISAPLALPPGVELRGVHDGAHDKAAALIDGDGIGANVVKLGTMLYPRGPAIGSAPFISVGSGSGVRGLSVYYKDQVLTTNPPYLIAFPATIALNGTDCYVVNVTLVNAYMGIDAGAAQDCSRHIIDRVKTCSLLYGVRVANSADGCVQDVDCHLRYWVHGPTGDILDAPFIAFGNVPSQALVEAVTRLSLTAYVIEPTTSERFLNPTVFAGAVGMRASGTFSNTGIVKCIALAVDSGVTACDVQSSDGDFNFVNSVLSVWPPIAATNNLTGVQVGNATGGVPTVRLFNSIITGTVGFGAVTLSGSLELQLLHLWPSDSWNTALGVGTASGTTTCINGLMGPNLSDNPTWTYLHVLGLGGTTALYGNLFREQAGTVIGAVTQTCSGVRVK